MIDLPNNLGKSEPCELGCAELMDSNHLLNCAHLNEGQFNNLTLKQFINGNINEKTEVFNKLQSNSNKRSQCIRKKIN